MDSDAKLENALVDLRREIPKSGFSEDLLEGISDDYGLNPKLLRRKFEESTGQRPEDYRVKPVEVSQRQKSIEMAAKLKNDPKVKGWKWKECAGEILKLPVVGIEKESVGGIEKEFVFVAGSGDQIYLIDIETGTHDARTLPKLRVDSLCRKVYSQKYPLSDSDPCIKLSSAEIAKLWLG